jgi:hypothetical protein
MNGALITFSEAARRKVFAFQGSSSKPPSWSTQISICNPEEYALKPWKIPTKLQRLEYWVLQPAVNLGLIQQQKLRP